MNKIVNIIDQLYQISLESQAHTQEIKNHMSSFRYKNEFQTIGIFAPRQTGKTYSIVHFCLKYSNRNILISTMNGKVIKTIKNRFKEINGEIPKNVFFEDDENLLNITEIDIHIIDESRYCENIKYPKYYADDFVEIRMC